MHSVPETSSEIMVNMVFVWEVEWSRCVVKITSRPCYSVGLETHLKVTETGKNKEIHTQKFLLLEMRPPRIHSNSVHSSILSQKILQHHGNKVTSDIRGILKHNSKLIHYNVWGKLERNGKGNEKEKEEGDR